MSKAVVVFFGALRVLQDGVERCVRRGMLIEFGDTQSLQEAANSGFGEFDLPDDDVAVVLDGKARQRTDSGTTT